MRDLLRIARSDVDVAVDSLVCREENARLFEEGFPSGQRDQTVNLTRKLRWFESSPLHHSAGRDSACDAPSGVAGAVSGRRV